MKCQSSLGPANWKCNCPPGRICQSGQCVCDKTCSGGQILNSNFCECSCPGGQTLCSGNCKDLSSDVQNCGSCGNACTSPNVCFDGCCITQRAAMISDHNLWLFNGCENIENLSVSLAITDDLVQTTAGYEVQGFTFQLNALNPNSSPSSTAWMQYVFSVAQGSIWGTVEYWDIGTDMISYQPPSSTINLPANALPTNTSTLPRGWTLNIDLTTDPGTGNVTGAAFSATDPSGKVWAGQPGIDIPPAFQFPIVAFQTNLVGFGNGSYTGFTQGAGTISYKSAAGLCVEGGGTDKCTGHLTFTAETSNASYGPLSPCCGSNITQSFTTEPV